MQCWLAWMFSSLWTDLETFPSKDSQRLVLRRSSLFLPEMKSPKESLNFHFCRPTFLLLILSQAGCTSLHTLLLLKMQVYVVIINFPQWSHIVTLCNWTVQMNFLLYGQHLLRAECPTSTLSFPTTLLATLNASNMHRFILKCKWPYMYMFAHSWSSSSFCNSISCWIVSFAFAFCPGTQHPVYCLSGMWMYCLWFTQDL